MIRFSKSVLVGIGMIAILGIVGGMLFRRDLSEKVVVHAGPGSIEKGKSKPQPPRVGTDQPRPGNHAEALEGISNDLTPARASQLFEDFKARHPANSERIAFARAIIQKLCELGYTQEAWDLIELNQGDVRNNQMMSFYENARASNGELLGRISGSPPTDIHVGLVGFLSRFSPEQYEEVLRSSDFRSFLQGVDKLDVQEAAAAKHFIGAAFGQTITVALYETPDQTKDLLKIAARLNSEGLLDTPRFMDLASRFGRGEPFENWGLISAIKPEADDRVRQLRSNMIRDMLEADAPKAISEVLDNQNPAKASDIKAAVESWVGFDSKGAADWFQQSRATLSPQDRDAVAAAFATYAGNLSEFSGAREWAAQIQDPLLKAELFRKIAEAAAAKDAAGQGNQ